MKEAVLDYNKMDFNKEIDYIIKSIQEYYEPFETKRAVLGISGGKDSTIVAMLLGEAIGYENVYGVMMPNGKQTDADSIRVIDILGINNFEVDISDAFDSLKDNVISQDVYDFGHEEKFTKSLTNLAPRLRMSTLYLIGQTIGAKVVGTSNGSEIWTGWFTKHGDSGNDGLAPLNKYTCIEVYGIGDVLARRFKDGQYGEELLELVTKTPEDGLTGKSDEENFGFTYQQLHDKIRFGTSGDWSVDNKIDKMVESTAHKRKIVMYPKSTQLYNDYLLQCIDNKIHVNVIGEDYDLL